MYDLYYSSFTKIVVKGMTKAEMVLKVRDFKLNGGRAF
jgi:hypothetical protein